MPKTKENKFAWQTRRDQGRRNLLKELSIKFGYWDGLSKKEKKALSLLDYDNGRNKTT
jgi:hypothetical protein